MPCEHMLHHYGTMTSLHGVLLATGVYDLMWYAPHYEPYHQYETTGIMCQWTLLPVLSGPIINVASPVEALFNVAVSVETL